MYKREDYLRKVRQWLGKECIIVLTGQRRVGKSCMLKVLKEEFSADNVIYIDKEKRDFDYIETYKELNEYIDQRYQKRKKNYILVDEVQEIDGWEKTVRDFRTEEDTEVIITGSNAQMLSSELSTLIGGRYKEILIQPLNYREFLEFYGIADSDDALGKFIQFGGMPGLLRIGLDANDAYEYLTDVYNTVLLKDVILRNKIRNAVFLENLVRFLADNCGKLISAGSIAKYMKSQVESVSSTTIIDYMRMLGEAYIISKVNRYDIHGKRLFESNDKFYFQDHGIRNALIGGNREGDIEKVIENIIYQELIRRGYSVTVGQLQVGEVDFVCEKKGGGRVYIQVSYVIADEATRKREFGNLSAINDNYSKYVISMSPLLSRSDSEGITHLHLRRFLMGEEL